MISPDVDCEAIIHLPTRYIGFGLFWPRRRSLGWELIRKRRIVEARWDIPPPNLEGSGKPSGFNQSISSGILNNL
jgi:hypothetical protein